ncbi:deoxyribose-phosphate aldolase [candidate division WOR-3 bacterium]|nr:deoxyribose-phosphate aldolase [candidate division WOR-3 bacterium]
MLVPHLDTTAVARLIDHTLLKPDARPEQVERLCAEAQEHGFATVCVNSGYVPLCRRQIKGSGVGVGTVVGFPLGAMLREAKAAETAAAVNLGADEVDMVMNVGWFKAGADEMVVSDIRRVVDAAQGRPVKVIIESCLLTDAEKERAAGLVKGAGAAFVKTSTGFSTGGATVEDVTRLRRTVGPDFGVKASGGIRDLATLLKMIEAGASRIGTSSGVAIVRQLAEGKSIKE